jgi:raffinose/stachyose/melibiose transport system substrate-binding protein
MKWTETHGRAPLTSTRSKLSTVRRAKTQLVSAFCVLAMVLGFITLPMSGAVSGAATKTTITYWFWGESDIPGITKWMQQRITTYEADNPGVKVDLVPQSNTTIIPSFTLAAQSKTGPDLDTQWATLPTILPALGGAVTPISNYVSKADTSHWLNTNENTYQGKIYAMPLYMIGVPLVFNKKLFKEAGLAPVAPATWAEFLADCKALKAKGITPIGMGNKDGYFGAWMFAIYEKQMLNTVSQLTEGVAGKGTAETKLMASLKSMYTSFQGLIKSGYVNSNVESLTLDQGWQLFPEGKAAMSFTTDGNVLSWAKTVGEANVGVGKPPILGKGALAATYDVTQSSDEFITSWSKNPKADAKFLEWLHEPVNMVALNKETGAFPADNQFPVSDITDPLARALDTLDTSGTSVWLENYIPPQIDSDADLPAGQLITSGSGTPAAAVALWQQQLSLWRTQQPTQFKQFSTWAAAS